MSTVVQPARHATNGTGTARPPNIPVLKSSRSRPNKNQRGWGNTPTPVIHKVLSYVLDDVALESGLRIAPQAVPVALAVARRLVLTNLRLVSEGWRTSIDCHSFWTDFQATLRPDLAGGSGVHLIAARAATIGVCVACKFHGNPGSAPVAIYFPTTKLHLLPTCRQHCDTYCSNCLRSSNGPGDSIWLRRPGAGDVDEYGCDRPCKGLLCSECRQAAFMSALRRDLVECARGGPVLGLAIPWLHTPAFRDHVFFGIGRSDMMARQAVEDMFLSIHTEMGEPRFMGQLTQLQHLLRHIKVLTWEQRSVSPRDMAMVQELAFAVLGSMADCLDMNIMFRRWQREMDAGTYDDDDYRLDVQQLRLGTGGSSLWPFVRARVVDRILSLWARDRFYAGLWVMPSDEIEQMVNPSAELHSSLQDMAERSVRPSDGRMVQTAVSNDHRGRFRYDSVNSPYSVQMFLPPDRLLQVMNIRFTDQASLQLETSLAEFVTMLRRVPHKEYDRLESICANEEVHGIVSKLHDPRLWPQSGVDTPLSREMSPAGGGTVLSSVDEDEDDDVSVSEQGKTFEERDVDELPQEQAEPRIEIVQFSVSNPPFEVREGWSSTGEEDGEDDDELQERGTSESAPPSPTLGKRKSEDDDALTVDSDRPTRPRLGSGETSHSGDSTNTALVTPDDSPSLLGEETIKVADMDVAADANAESITIDEVTVAPSNTESPKLRKRKSPEDDELAQPHRRRSSAGVSEASEGDVVEEERVESDAEDGADKPSLDAIADVFRVHMEERRKEEEQKVRETEVSMVSDRDEDTASEPEKDPTTAAIERVVAMADREDDDDEWPFSDDEDSYVSEEAFERDYPCVPPADAKLGPGMSSLVQEVFYRVRAPLRRCYCRICVRAERAQAAAMHHVFISAAVDMDAASGGIHIA